MAKFLLQEKSLDYYLKVPWANNDVKMMQAEIDLPVRIADCDYLGHVNNTAYIGYVIEGMTQIFPPTLVSQVKITHAAINYLRQAKYGSPVTVQMWLLDTGTTWFTVRQGEDTVANGKFVWSGPVEIFQYLTHTNETELPKIKALDFKVEDLGKPFRYTYRIQSRDLTPTGYFSPTSFIHLVDEAIWIALEAQEWSFQRMQRENCAIYVINHALEVFDFPEWPVGETITIVSQLQNFRKVRGTWRHEFYRSGTQILMAREYATGAFMTLDGQIREPIDGLIAKCLLGSPM